MAEGADLNDDMLLVSGNEGLATGTPASAEGLTTDGGFLGFGSKLVSDREAAALRQIEGALT